MKSGLSSPQRAAVFAFLYAIFVLSCGCAKFPAGPGNGHAKRLTFTITFEGAIRQEPTVDVPRPAYYFILIDNDDDPGGQNGPVPVVAPPWGNGYAAGHYTHMIVLGQFLGAPTWDYFLYEMNDPDGSLNEPVLIGQPVSYTTPRPGDIVIRFEIDLLQISPDLHSALDITHLQINFIATDDVPTDPDVPGKFWDALGAGEGELNSFINIDVRQDIRYDLEYFTSLTEPAGDVADSALDIVDFSIEVTS
jgi:hypothetical protein